MQAGLYDATGSTLIYTWDELVDEGLIDEQVWDFNDAETTTAQGGFVEEDSYYQDACVVVIPDTVDSLSDLIPFPNMKAVIIPSNVTIAQNAFQYNTALEAIYYDGSTTNSPWGATGAQVLAYDAFTPSGGASRIMSEAAGIVLANKIKNLMARVAALEAVQLGTFEYEDATGNLYYVTDDGT